MLRASIAKGEKPTVDPEGGDYKQGMIRGFAMITKGEALGHGMWIDDAFLDQTVEAMKADGSVKSRFTHPSLSGDGLGKFLGRAKNARREGDKVLADLHFSESSHVSPDGDLAKYVMTLAKEDPEAFGASIVFEHDPQLAGEFAGDNLDKDGEFVSPDKANEKNLPHARLRKLYAADIVDEPAANPDGLFHRGDKIAKEADELLSFALGLSTKQPELTCFDVNPDRVSGFFQRFMVQHGLSVVRTQEAQHMADNPTNGAQDTNKPAEVDLSKERLAALKSKYDDSAFVLEMFEAGKSMAEAETEWLRRENVKQAEKLAALESQLKQLQSQSPKVEADGAKPVAFGATEAPKTESIVERATKLAKEEKIPFYAAMQKLSNENPDEYENYVDSIPVQKRRAN